MIDKFTEKIAAIGIPLLLLSIVKLLTGNNGASALTDGLEDLGFGFGMTGGIVFLIFLALLTDSFVKYLFERKFNKLLEKLKSENFSRNDIINTISKKILYSKELRNKTLIKLALVEE